MARNRDAVHALSTYLCPECGNQFDLRRDKWITKRSKAQRRRDSEHGEYSRATTSSSSVTYTVAGSHDNCDTDDNAFVIVTCDNRSCSQYEVVKVIRIPRVGTASTELTLVEG